VSEERGNGLGAVAKRELPTLVQRSRDHTNGSIVGSSEHLHGKDVQKYVDATAESLPPVGFRDSAALEKWANNNGGAQELPGGGLKIGGSVYVPTNSANYRNSLAAGSGFNGSGFDADHAIARSTAKQEGIAYVQMGWSPPSVNRAVGSMHERSVQSYTNEIDGAIFHNPVSYMKSIGSSSGTQFAFEAAFAYVAPPSPPQNPSKLHAEKQVIYNRGNR